MGGAVTPLFLYVFVARTGTSLPLRLFDTASHKGTWHDDTGRGHSLTSGTWHDDHDDTGGSRGPLQASNARSTADKRHSRVRSRYFAPDTCSWWRNSKHCELRALGSSSGTTQKRASTDITMKVNSFNNYFWRHCYIKCLVSCFVYDLCLPENVDLVQ